MRVDTFFSTAVNNISEVVKDGSADTWTHSINSLEPQYLRPIFVRGWNFTENNLTKEDITPWDANMVFVSVFCLRRFEIIKIPRATATLVNGRYIGSNTQLRISDLRLASSWKMRQMRETNQSRSLFQPLISSLSWVAIMKLTAQGLF